MGPKGPGRASIGSRDGLRFIWTNFQPKWAHLGPNRVPFCFSISQKPILGPNSSKSTLGPGAIGPRAPSNMGSRAHGGRRPTFRRGVGGRSPPTAMRGVWGGGSPPTEKGPLELLQTAKSETLQLHSGVTSSNFTGVRPLLLLPLGGRMGCLFSLLQTAFQLRVTSRCVAPS